jgi:hypothetical protein
VAYTALTHAYAVSKHRTPLRGTQPLYEACLSGVCFFKMHTPLERSIRFLGLFWALVRSWALLQIISRTHLLIVTFDRQDSIIIGTGDSEFW